MKETGKFIGYLPAAKEAEFEKSDGGEILSLLVSDHLARRMDLTELVKSGKEVAITTELTVDDVVAQ